MPSSANQSVWFDWSIHRVISIPHGYPNPIPSKSSSTRSIKWKNPLIKKPPDSHDVIQSPELPVRQFGIALRWWILRLFITLCFPIVLTLKPSRSINLSTFQLPRPISPSLLLPSTSIQNRNTYPALRGRAINSLTWKFRSLGVWASNGFSRSAVCQSRSDGSRWSFAPKSEQTPPVLPRNVFIGKGPSLYNEKWS